MSHFTVIVTDTNDVNHERQLEPFFEQGDESDYFMEKEIQVFAEDMEKEAKAITQELIDRNKEGRSDDTIAKYELHIEAGNFREVVKSWHGGEFDNAGNLYWLNNPDAQWDWYSVGGRWSGYFQLKPNATDSEIVLSEHWGQKEGHTEKLREQRRTDIAKIKDIDWQAMKDKNVKRAEKLWSEYEKAKDKLRKEPENEKNHFNAYFDYGVLKDETKEEFMKRQSSIAPFALLHDGQWYERGNMGWFGIVDNEKDPEDWDEMFDAIIAELSPESELTLVDCHI